jgi:hypothetical protein
LTETSELSPIFVDCLIGRGQGLKAMDRPHPQPAPLQRRGSSVESEERMRSGEIAGFDRPHLGTQKRAIALSLAGLRSICPEGEGVYVCCRSPIE